MESRDAEIRRLKTENEKLREDTQGFGVSSPHSPLKQLAQLGDSSLLSPSEAGIMGRDYESVDIGAGEEWVGL